MLDINSGLVRTEVLKVKRAGGDKSLMDSLSSIRKQDINEEDTFQSAEGTLPCLKYKQGYSVHEIHKNEFKTKQNKKIETK